MNSAKQQEELKKEALANVRQAQALLSKAIGQYQQYLSLPGNENDSDGWAGLGGAFRRAGKTDEAIESYEKAYRVDATSTYALVNMVSLLAARNRQGDEARLAQYAAEAQALLESRTKAGDCDHWTWYDLATMQLLGGKASEAMAVLDRAIAKTPSADHFPSVLSNLEFLRAHRPGIEGIDQAIERIKARLN